jgi:hypothetical protein
MMMVPPVEPPVTPVTQECMVYVSQQVQLSLVVLYGVLYTERGTPGQVTRNTNGTYDIGPMQLNNKFWVPFFERNYGWKEIQLRNNGCLNVLAGAIVLRMRIAEAGGDIWKGIGNYHSRTPVHHQKYQLKVAGMLTRWGVVGTQQAAAPAQAVVEPDTSDAVPKVVAQDPVYRRY